MKRDLSFVGVSHCPLQTIHIIHNVPFYVMSTQQLNYAKLHRCENCAHSHHSKCCRHIYKVNSPTWTGSLRALLQTQSFSTYKYLSPKHHKIWFAKTKKSISFSWFPWTVNMLSSCKKCSVWVIKDSLCCHNMLAVT